MKFLLSLLFLMIFSVTILLYLLSLNNFLPMDVQGDYNWVNISVFSTLFFILISSTISLILYPILVFIFKRENNDHLKVLVVKTGFLVAIGIFLAILLNFFHILDIYWSLGILTILVAASFVI